MREMRQGTREREGQEWGKRRASRGKRGTMGARGEQEGGKKEARRRQEGGEKGQEQEETKGGAE